jgi:DNA-binding transcriptional ArsR family regulator
MEDLEQQAIIKALNHPLRIRLLAILTQRTASPKEMAAELDEPLPRVAYHSRQLERYGIVEVVEEEPVRGAVQHFYRSMARPLLGAAEWEGLSPAVRLVALEYGLTRIAREAGAALQAGTFDKRAERHLSRTPLLLDEEGWIKVLKIVDSALERVLDEQAASAERMNGDDGTATRIPTMVAMLCYEQPERPK